MITSECEGLARGGGNAVDTGRQDEKQQDHRDPDYGPVGHGRAQDVQKRIAR